MRDSARTSSDAQSPRPMRSARSAICAAGHPERELRRAAEAAEAAAHAAPHLRLHLLSAHVEHCPQPLACLALTLLLFIFLPR
jgi:hypothetical protein